MRTALALALVSGLLLGGCEENAIDDAPTQTNVTGVLIVKLTDSPAAYDAVNIVVDSIAVHLNGDDSLSGWHTITTTPAQYDLLMLANGRDTIVAQAPIPAGSYSQMRLFVGEGSNVIVDGTLHALEIPSGTQTGLTLNIQANIIAFMPYEVLLDFNASRSIVAMGNGRYLLKPVIKVISTALTGVVFGQAIPASSPIAVYAIAGTDTIMTFADSTGFFRLNYLTPATYQIVIVPSDTMYGSTALDDIVVVPRVDRSVGTVFLPLK